MEIIPLLNFRMCRHKSTLGIEDSALEGLAVLEGLVESLRGVELHIDVVMSPFHVAP